MTRMPLKLIAQTPDLTITPHALYDAFGNDKMSRTGAYKELFKDHLDQGVLDDIRAAWQTGTPLGNDYFREKIEKKLKCKVGQARRGRPNQTNNEAEAPIKGL